MGRQWEILSSNNASYYIEVIMEHWTEKYGIGTHIREAILTLKGIMKEPCKNCGACDHCEICDHCKKCKNCGKEVITLPFPFYPIYPPTALPYQPLPYTPYIGDPLYNPLGGTTGASWSWTITEPLTIRSEEHTSE